ncbi:hypothetical protein OF83DRAFT_1168648 [Amylostereum chailletii]|nr:hypothetical protein OF83DRAFT_1168648 [Amylostereum chailletii]
MPHSQQSPAVSQQSRTPQGSPQTPLDKGKASARTPEVHVNGSPVAAPKLRPTRSLTNGGQAEETAWGAHFWVTLVDPQTQSSFFACPATGEVSWDPPVGNFVLPPNDSGEWWEIADESRGGIPYYYHTKSGETVWEKPEGFVIPLSVLQNTALGRRLSKSFHNPSVAPASDIPPHAASGRRPKPALKDRRPATSHNGQAPTRMQPSTSSNGQYKKTAHLPMRRSFSSEQYHGLNHLAVNSLPPIPGSPYTTDASAPPSPTSARSPAASVHRSGSGKSQRSQRSTRSTRFAVDPPSPSTKTPNGTPPRNGDASRSKPPTPTAFRPTRTPPQSLHAAVELLAQSQSTPPSPTSAGMSTPESGYASQAERDSPPRTMPPPSPLSATPSSGPPPVPATPRGPRVHGKEISGPTLNQEATMNLSPVKSRSAGKPIPISKQPVASLVATLRTGMYPILPEDLASDIQQFVESDFARQYFSTHRTGIIFKRKVPMEQMMTWQKAPLPSPLLNITGSLHKDAVRIFKVIQRLMGDREREGRPQRLPDPASSLNASTSSLSPAAISLYEEERWLLGEGLGHGELRDEIYCQVMKQLTGNPNTESVFKGWQLLCVLLITFPPSKNFETYLQSFLKQRTTQTEGRVDVMAKYCLKRLSIVAKKGPRGKPPTIAEIETASDAAFNPSTFGESLDAIYRLQERNYPHQKIPIILPFLADGILALGGTKSEGIFRVPGDGDLVSELKLRIDRGYYTLEGVDDPHVLASLLKLWLRELRDPLVPEEMYNDCIEYARDPEACVGVVERLPTINRRVVLFVVSFLQLFLDERVLAITKMTSANLALVMAPNLLRCNSESMAVVFTNAQYEQTFVHNLLLHLKCDKIDPEYIPKHGLGAVSTSAPPRTSKSRPRH